MQGRCSSWAGPVTMHSMATLSLIRKMPRRCLGWRTTSPAAPHQAGDDLEHFEVPPAQSVHHEGQQLQDLRLAPVLVNPGLEVVGVLQRVSTLNRN